MAGIHAYAKNPLMTCFLLALLSAHVHAAGETIRVGVYENSPKIYTDEQGTVAGFFPSVIEAIAQKEGWNIVYVNGSWDESLRRVETGEIDMMPDVALSPERAERFVFNNETVFVNWGEVYAANDGSIEDFLDLDNKRVAVMRGSIHTDGPMGIINLTREFDISIVPVYVDGYDQVFESLRNGSADAGVVNRIFGESNAKKYGVYPTPIIFDPSQLRFAFPKNGTLTPFLIGRIDADLREMKADPDSAYYSAMTEYLTGYVGTVQEIPLWGWVLLGSLALLTAMAGLFSFIYREQKNTIKKERDALDRANQLKTLFIDIMRHDLLNPSAVIKANAQMLLAKEGSAEKKAMLGLTYEVSDKMISRIKDASLLSKLEDGTEKFELTATELGGVIRGVLKETASLAREKGIRITPKVKGRCFAMASPMVHEAIFNLVTNAIKYSPENTEITVGMSRNGGMCRITVADQGTGVPENCKRAIFERFRGSGRGCIRGTGLGLAITQKLMGLYRGKVWVEDNKGRGSVFVVELPESKAAPAHTGI